MKDELDWKFTSSKQLNIWKVNYTLTISQTLEFAYVTFDIDLNLSGKPVTWILIRQTGCFHKAVKNGHPYYSQPGEYGSKIPDKFKLGHLRPKLTSLAKLSDKNMKSDVREFKHRWSFVRLKLAFHIFNCFELVNFQSSSSFNSFT